MSIEPPITVRELKDYADQLARETRQVASDLAKDTETWRVQVENRLSKLEVKMNIIAGLAGIGASAGVIDALLRLTH